jgi:selenium metabolism protein YedF
MADSGTGRGGTIVFLGSDELGSGAPELGRILMRSFLKTLKDAQPKPSRILLINSGVRMVAEGSDSIAELKDLEAAGIDLAACGTCLDYFHLKEKVQVGHPTNMQDIVSALLGSDKVVRP